MRRPVIVSTDVTELINKHVSTCTYFRDGWTISLGAVLYRISWYGHHRNMSYT
jgi:hypothetical protein